MKRYQYEITRHSGEEFTKLVYACSGEGECSLDHIPLDQVVTLEEILNERGVLGWELLQVIFKNEGLIAFWKKEMISVDREGALTS
jgi:hypothetical protein